ncbi:MAG: hypothetical protein VB070_15790, partial [Clostridiaceae bacterium]|nr:hypothetical protein [Clostridiaceae bacterium]
HRFKDLKNVMYACFLSEDLMIARNSSGAYKIYDLEKMETIKQFIPPKVNLCSQNNIFIALADNVYLYDILAHKQFSDVRFYRINYRTGEMKSIQIAEDILLTQNMTYIEETGKIRFMHYGAVDDTQGRDLVFCEIIEIDPEQETVEIIYSDRTPIKQIALLYFDCYFILKKTMEIIDIRTGKVVRKLNYSVDERKWGYFNKCEHYNNYIVVPMHKRIDVLNFQTDEIVYTYEGAVFDLYVWKNNIYIDDMYKIIIFEGVL